MGAIQLRQMYPMERETNKAVIYPATKTDKVNDTKYYSIFTTGFSQQRLTAYVTSPQSINL